MSAQDNRFQFGTPIGVGRGRGMYAPVPFSIDSLTPGGAMPALDAIPGPRARPATDHHTSTPMPHVTPTLTPSDGPECVADLMRTVIQEIGHQLADNIMSHIQPHHTVAPSPAATRNVASTLSQSSHVSDASQVQVVTQRKVKEPPCFVGNSSDSVTVHDWEDQMRTFIKKSNVRIEEQAEEILLHLRGKAKDVVRFGIRNGNIDINANPDMIYGLLRKHFSSTKYSAVPLADFTLTPLLIL